MWSEHISKRGRPIVHTGVATRVEDGVASVEIEKLSACDECRAKLLCVGGHGRAGLIRAECLEPLGPGDRVRLEMPPAAGWFAVLIAFVLPFILLVTTFFTLEAHGAGELVAGLAALLVLPVYYVLAYTQRNRMARFVHIGAYRMNTGERGTL